MWDKTEVEIFSSFSFDHVLEVRDRFLKSNVDFVFNNVYAPCDARSQHVLWESLSARLAIYDGINICVCGYFNVVRGVEERRSSVSFTSLTCVPSFNNFIESNAMVDLLPLIGRRFTWYRGDGRAMSRLDRFLLSERWCLSWPNCIQVAQLRGLSDHCALVLSADEQNWGPKPFRMLKCWVDVPRYKNFVSNKLRALQVEGWGGYVLKEKFKMIKMALREWHQTHTQNIPIKISTVTDRIATLDAKREATTLDEEEVEELHSLSDELCSLSRIHSSITWQQSRVNWLREGDANSKKNHETMSQRRRVNTIYVLHIGGVQVEGVDNVREAVFNHFSNHFQSDVVERPSPMHLNFCMLSYRDGAAFVKPFSMEELKVAVWDCDSFKCSGPDGVNFGFIKDF